MFSSPRYVYRSDYTKLWIQVNEHLLTQPTEFLLQLRADLESAVLIDADNTSHDVVTLDSRVSYETSVTGEIAEITLTLPERAQATRGAISVFTPLGAALFGRRTGQSVNSWNHDGVRRLRILRVMPAASGSPCVSAEERGSAS